MRLSELNMGESAVVVKVLGTGAFRKRITEMGFVKGRKVTPIKAAPLNDPIEYSLLGYSVTLRRNEANFIEVLSPKEIDSKLLTPAVNGFHTLEQTEEEVLKQTAKEKGKNIQVALIGNPNCGKTTLFNFASNSREHVGNYGGVTVESKTAVFHHKGYTFHLTDLPGTYSLSAYSPEELFVRNFIFENTPDIIINVVDATNLERNLYLTTQLIDLDIKMVVALNMYDELQAGGDKLDYQYLSKMLGIPFVPTISTKGYGIRELFDKVINVYTDKDKTYRHVDLNYGNEIEQSICKLQKAIKANTELTTYISSRFLAIKLLEKDKQVQTLIKECENAKEIESICNSEIHRLELLFAEDTETLITDTRYGIISGALKETYEPGNLPRRKLSDAIDTILTNKALGFPIFFIFLFLMFQVTFSLGAYPQDWIESFVGIVGEGIRQLMPPGPLTDLIADGVVNGVGSVLVFLPNIILLFLFISFMEDTGYMARVAFIMDKLMHKIGLHGKSFIPLIMGFGCNVPAIMSTRTIENRNNRILTILITPFMSCSARLPVYILFVSAFFPNYAGIALFIIYLVGILLAIGMAMLFKKTLFKADELPFVMELPPYRMPTLRSIFKHMWFKSQQYLRKMGSVILVASIIIWALGYFPRKVEYSRDYAKEIQLVEEQYNSLLITANNRDALQAEKENKINELALAQKSEHQEKSYIGRIGKFIEPAMLPLGFDWKLSVSLLSGIAAKEVIISTMGVMFQASGEDEENISLQEKLKQHTYSEGTKKGQPVFTPLTVISLIVFILIYFPCVGVMAAISKETGSWKWAFFVIFYTTALAWILSFAVYQIGSLLI
ncbi:MAG: ferrous iron transport protein B [Bacteroidales bacterium]|nr:ferrous iron transport protein B [Bacteroidales bacterium]